MLQVDHISNVLQSLLYYCEHGGVDRVGLKPNPLDPIFF